MAVDRERVSRRAKVISPHSAPGLFLHNAHSSFHADSARRLRADGIAKDAAAEAGGRAATPLDIAARDERDCMEEAAAALGANGTGEHSRVRIGVAWRRRRPTSWGMAPRRVRSGSLLNRDRTSLPRSALVGWCDGRSLGIEERCSPELLSPRCDASSGERYWSLARSVHHALAAPPTGRRPRLRPLALSPRTRSRCARSSVSRVTRRR